VVRRDTCSLVAKLMEGSLRTLFSSKDLSLVKSYLQNQFRKINAGRVPLSEYVLSSKVKLGHYAADRRKGANVHPPPSAVVAKRRMLQDPRAAPLYKQRVPYVVVCGPPKTILVDLVVHPHDYYGDSGMRVNTIYYVTKQASAT
jgi:DNA polymerase zeta